MKNQNKICVLGIWHLGAVYSTCLADLGFFVSGFDPSTDRIKELNSAIPPLFEPGLKELLTSGLAAGRLHYTASIPEAVEGATLVWITFDTPVDDEDNIDLSSVFNICRQLAPALENNVIVIIRRPGPAGTCHSLKTLIQDNNPELDFDIVYSPENLRLGKAVDYFKKPDRIVLGADNDSTLERLENLLEVIPAPKIKMDLKSAEMTKHALNAFMATSISFANEMANLCEEIGADAVKVAQALKSDSRMGPGIPLYPGLAFSGGTLARDLKILKDLGSKNSCQMQMIEAALGINSRQNSLIERKLRKKYGSLAGIQAGILGLTYKAGTSTLRRSAALEIIASLSQAGVKIKVFDPKADLQELKQQTGLESMPSAYETARGADALIILTEWPEFKELDFSRIKEIMKNPFIIDGKNLLDGIYLQKQGFIYSGIGR